MRVRLLLLIVVLLVAVVTLFLLLLATDTALSVWQRLREAPLWLQVAYTLVLLSISSVTLWLSWRWLKPADKKDPGRKKELDPFSLQQELVESADVVAKELGGKSKSDRSGGRFGASIRPQVPRGRRRKGARSLPRKAPTSLFAESAAGGQGQSCTFLSTQRQNFGTFVGVGETVGNRGGKAAQSPDGARLRSGDHRCPASGSAKGTPRSSPSGRRSSSCRSRSSSSRLPPPLPRLRVLRSLGL